MQVSATLIAAQQAAREARARLQVPQAQPSPTNFAAALGKGFAPLPLKQTATAAATAPTAQTAAPARMGTKLDITV
jgi:hypothetical protein